MNDFPRLDTPTVLDGPEDDFNEHERTIAANVRNHQFHMWAIGPDRSAPGFTYTVGWWLNLNHPEIITRGLPMDAAHATLWNTWRYVKEHGPLPVAQPVKGIGAIDVWFMPVSEAEKLDHMISCRWLYRRDDFPALQLVWADMQNRMPWEEGFDRQFIRDQPDMSGQGWRRVLGLPEPDPPAAAAPKRSLWDRMTGKR